MHQPVEPMIKFIRLVTGEDIIARVIHVNHNNENYYKIINPLKIVYMIGDIPGSMNLSLIEWVFPRISHNQEFQISPTNIMVMSDVSDELTLYYNDSFISRDTSIGIHRDKTSANWIEKLMKEALNDEEFDEDFDDYLKDTSKNNKRLN